MANYNQLNTIGSGAYFPIKLEQAVGSDGKLESVQLPDPHSYLNLSNRPKIQTRRLWFSNLGMFGRT